MWDNFTLIAAVPGLRWLHEPDCVAFLVEVILWGDATGAECLDDPRDLSLVDTRR
jgi:hypothetical protein